MGWWSNGKTPPRHGGNSGFERPFSYLSLLKSAKYKVFWEFENLWFSNREKDYRKSQEEFTNYK